MVVTFLIFSGRRQDNDLCLLYVLHTWKFLFNFLFSLVIPNNQKNNKIVFRLWKYAKTIISDKNVMLPPFWSRVYDKCRHSLAAVITVKSMNMIQRVMQGSILLIWISFNLSIDK